MQRVIATLAVMAMCLLLPLWALADDIDEADNAAQTASWLSAAAARYRTGEHAGLPLFSATVMEALPPAEEFAERANWCSYYCCAPEIRLASSSELPGSAGLAYGPALLDDFLLETAWVEGAAGPGLGESVSFSIITAGSDTDSDYSRQYINGFEIVNGYAKSKALHAANGCPQLLRVWFDGTAVCCVKLLDSMGIQEVEFEPLALAGAGNHELRLELLDVRAGSKYEDTAITDILLRGGPCH